MVIGADTVVGRAIVAALVDPIREVRAFVSDPEVADLLRAAKVKTALGDVSDDSHVEAACLNAHTAVLIAGAAGDGRECSFAGSTTAVFRGWARAISAAGVRRAIWVGDESPPEASVPEQARVSTDQPVEALVNAVVSLDSAESLPDP